MYVLYCHCHCHLSSVICHLSSVICHLSSVICHCHLPSFFRSLRLTRPSPHLVLATEARVVRSFLGDDDVVRMAFLNRSRGYLDEP